MLDVPYASVVSRIVITINLWASEEDLITLIISYFTQSMHRSLLPGFKYLPRQQRQRRRAILAIPQPFTGLAELSGCEDGEYGWNPYFRGVLAWEHDAALRVTYYVYYQNAPVLPVAKGACVKSAGVSRRLLPKAGAVPLSARFGLLRLPHPLVLSDGVQRSPGHPARPFSSTGAITHTCPPNPYFWAPLRLLHPSRRYTALLAWSFQIPP